MPHNLSTRFCHQRVLSKYKDTNRIISLPNVGIFTTVRDKGSDRLRLPRVQSLVGGRSHWDRVAESAVVSVGGVTVEVGPRAQT